MEFVETIFIAIGLAMDAFAVSVCKGLSMKKISWKKAVIIAAYFGIFQMLMPLVGYILGISFSDLIRNIDHWIAFILLSFIGGKMIREAYCKEESINDKIDMNTMILLAIATSIDALAVGITYAFLDAHNVFLSFSLIGIITFAISLIGVKVGNKFGDKYGTKTQIFGGVILIIMGIKILIAHTIF